MPCGCGKKKTKVGDLGVSGCTGPNCASNNKVETQQVKPVKQTKPDVEKLRTAALLRRKVATKVTTTKKQK